jgi:hypothetical protein
MYRQTPIDHAIFFNGEEVLCAPFDAQAKPDQEQKGRDAAAPERPTGDQAHKAAPLQAAV